MFEKEAEIYALSNFGFRGKNSQRVLTAKIDYQYGAEFGYNKALEDIMAKVKFHGLISTELCYSDVFDYENNRISEDVLWSRFEDNAQRELSMIITDMRIKELRNV